MECGKSVVKWYKSKKNIYTCHNIKNKIREIYGWCTLKIYKQEKVRLYGTDCHDSLRISPDGRTLSYKNLQNGDGSRYGDYRFCDDEGKTPKEDEVLLAHGADAYFNIGGFKKWQDKNYYRV